MERDEYIDTVNRVLEGASSSAKTKLVAAIPLVPQNTTELTIEVFVDQDGEGFLEVQLGLDGPDLYVLNKRIEKYATLFETRMGEDGFEHGLPLMDPFDSKFSVKDVLTDCAGTWIASIWNSIDSPGLSVPIVIRSHDEYGTTLPVRLG